MRFKTILRHMQANHANEIPPRKRAVAKAPAKSKINKEDQHAQKSYN